MKFKKIVSSFIIATNASTFNAGNQIRRTLRGEWIDQLNENNVRHQRAAQVDSEQGFHSLATMMLYMNGFGQDFGNPENNGQYMDALYDLEQYITNYGCHCWIDGASAGVIGGGKSKDVTDHHCQELHSCYKCANMDFGNTNFEYSAWFEVDESGYRFLDCSANSEQDALGVCECDKRFAEAIAQTRRNCDAGMRKDEKHGSNCMTESWRTVNAGGVFDSRNQCEKSFSDGPVKNQCCGTYPNR